MKNISLLLLITTALLTSCVSKFPESIYRKSLSESGNLKNEEYNRHIKITEISNFRDIGGLNTQDGKKIKWGKIYRSGNLSRLQKSEFVKFNSLQIKTVIDLRTEAEIEEKHDHLPEKIDYFSIPIVSDQGDIMGQMKGKVLRGEITEAESKMLMEEFYTKCVIENIPLLKEIILKIVTSETPILYHCSAGKDRTGIVTAILLSILNVDRETIINEYLLSNYYRSSKIKGTINKAKILKVIKPKLNTTVIFNFMAVDSDYINAVFEIIDQKYGGIENFISKELAIDFILRKKIINQLTY